MTGMVQIRDMYVECSLQVRNHHKQGVAMSDCCRQLATTAVVMEDGKQMWRCGKHRGIRRLEVGPVVTKILRKA